MPIPIPLVKEFKSSTPLVEIRCGTLAPICISLTSSTVLFNGLSFLPEPKVDVELPKQSGGLGEEACRITLPTSNTLHAGILTLVELLTGPRAVAPTLLRVFNLITTAAEETQVVYLFDGVLNTDTRNPEGQSGLVRMEFEPDHMLFLSDSTLGRRTDATCDWSYGGTGCYVDVRTLLNPSLYGSYVNSIFQMYVTCSVDAQSTGRRVTLAVDPGNHSGAPAGTLTGHSQKWWNRGYLEKDGLRIMISDWRWDSSLGQGTDDFILTRMPPLSWDGAVLLLHPGCQKTPEACALRNNSERFSGLGFGIPAYNPVIESLGD